MNNAPVIIVLAIAIIGMISIVVDMIVNKNNQEEPNDYEW